MMKVMEIVLKVVLGIVFTPVDYLLGLYHLYKGKASLYTGLKVEGKSLTAKMFMNKIWKSNSFTIMNDDSGRKIIFCHGLPGGYMSPTGPITEKSFLDSLPAGEYNIVSCYGGTRSEKITNGVATITRKEDCNSVYCALALYVPGGLLVFSSQLATAVGLLILSQYKMAKTALFGTKEEWLKISTVPLKERTVISAEGLPKNLHFHSAGER